MTRNAFVAVLALSATAHAYVLKTDAEGQPIFWQTSPTFTMSPKLAQALGVPDAQAAAAAAVGTYAAQLPALGITFQVEETASQNSNAIIAIDHDWPYDPDAIAVTLLTVDPTHNAIRVANIALNTERHQFAVLPANATPGGPYDDLQNTLTHELGHALGLAHNNDDPTVVMYPGAPKGQVSKRTLTADDEAGLAALYANLTPGPLPSAPQTQGCASASGGPSALLGALLLGWTLSRRNRA